MQAKSLSYFRGGTVMKFIPLTKNAQSGDGRLIKCPECGHIEAVSHLNFSTIGCLGCEKSIEKYDLLINEP